MCVQQHKETHTGWKLSL